MSCPTCEHTLQFVGGGNFHCPRCGTITSRDLHGGQHVTVPALVARCREFADHIEDSWAIEETWRRLGIAEAIAPPEERREKKP